MRPPPPAKAPACTALPSLSPLDGDASPHTACHTPTLPRPAPCAHCARWTALRFWQPYLVGTKPPRACCPPSAGAAPTTPAPCASTHLPSQQSNHQAMVCMLRHRAAAGAAPTTPAPCASATRRRPAGCSSAARCASTHSARTTCLRVGGVQCACCERCDARAAWVEHSDSERCGVASRAWVAQCAQGAWRTLRGARAARSVPRTKRRGAQAGRGLQCLTSMVWLEEQRGHSCLEVSCVQHQAALLRGCAATLLEMCWSREESHPPLSQHMLGVQCIHDVYQGTERAQGQLHRTMLSTFIHGILLVMGPSSQLHAHGTLSDGAQLSAACTWDLK